jgi:hypothetical protein
MAPHGSSLKTCSCKHQTVAGKLTWNHMDFNLQTTLDFARIFLNKHIHIYNFETNKTLLIYMLTH